MLEGLDMQVSTGETIFFNDEQRGRSATELFGFFLRTYVDITKHQFHRRTLFTGPFNREIFSILDGKDKRVWKYIKEIE